MENPVESVISTEAGDLKIADTAAAPAAHYLTGKEHPGYCMSCRKKGVFKVTEVTAESQHPDKTEMVKGNCTVCGKRVNVISKKQTSAPESPAGKEEIKA